MTAAYHPIGSSQAIATGRLAKPSRPFAPRCYNPAPKKLPYPQDACIALKHLYLREDLKDKIFHSPKFELSSREIFWPCTFRPQPRTRSKEHESFGIYMFGQKTLRPYGAKFIWAWGSSSSSFRSMHVHLRCWSGDDPSVWIETHMEIRV